MSVRQGKLVVLSAPSGAGKSTIAGALLKRHPGELKLSISFTTRAPRGEEKNGVHYHFVGEDQFRTMIDRGEFLEHAHVFGKYFYGTSKAAVEGELSAGHSVLFDIDVQGAKSLKKTFGDRCITIFIQPPSFDELAARLRGRGTEDTKAVDLRLETARKELEQAGFFDHQVVNQRIEDSVAAVEAILKKAGCIP